MGCVCVRERERDRMQAWDSVLKFVKPYDNRCYLCHIPKSGAPSAS